MKLIAALKTWVVIYPSITLFNFLFGEGLANFPAYQRTLILTVTLVLWMIFVAIPFIDLLIGKISTKTGMK
ncbi:hypothetical protein [Mucilaginibacter sp.]|uniref:hypothetical protein n=1 Tax=Mucilaginibacter sp. TaxID=1882438 RepID=UPI002CD524AA|nr:hypothetical protein [Mucilaginibacter sp.]HTI61296.1 hypothetical protein [Mucilaginibacter sp.]